MGGLRIRLGAAPQPISLAVNRAALAVTGRDVALAIGPNEFTDTFSVNQAPLASPWVSPGTSGFFTVTANGGVAFASTASDSGYPDCYARHPGFTGDYEIEAIVARGTVPGVNHEVELHVAMVEDVGDDITYSVEWLTNDDGGMQFMKWRSPNDGTTFFEELSGTPSNGGTPGGPLPDGTVLKWRKVGSTGFAYYNGTLIWTVPLPTLRPDGTTPWGDGNPAIAFFVRGGGTPSAFGFSQVTIRQL